MPSKPDDLGDLEIDIDALLDADDAPRSPHWRRQVVGKGTDDLVAARSEDRKIHFIISARAARLAAEVAYAADISRESWFRIVVAEALEKATGVPAADLIGRPGIHRPHSYLPSHYGQRT